MAGTRAPDRATLTHFQNQFTLHKLCEAAVVHRRHEQEESMDKRTIGTWSVVAVLIPFWPQRSCLLMKA
jgi:hypothetical protein